MYQAVAYHKNSNMVHIWDDEKGHFKIKYKPYAYRKSSYGKFVALDGQQVDKVYDFDRDDKGLYESDINPETRTLIEILESSTPGPVKLKVTSSNSQDLKLATELLQEEIQAAMKAPDYTGKEGARLRKEASEWAVKREHLFALAHEMYVVFEREAREC